MHGNNGELNAVCDISNIPDIFDYLENFVPSCWNNNISGANISILNMI